MKTSRFFSSIAALPLLGFMPSHHSLAALRSAPPTPTQGIVGHATAVVPYGYGVGGPPFPGNPTTLKQYQDTNFKIARDDFQWQAIESSPGVYDFSKYDQEMAQYKAIGVRPIWILDYTNTNYDDNEPPHTTAGIQGYASFAKAAAAHFKSQGVLWEIWNEPNEPNFWSTGPNADQYAALVKATVPAIRSADPNATILAGCISQINIPYITAFLKDEPLNGVSYFSIHPYREGQPETVISDYAKVRSLIAEYTPPGRKPTPIACSEWGYTTAVGQSIEAEQSRYLERMYLTNLLCGVNITSVYRYANDGSDPASFENNYGIVTDKLVPKPAYTALSRLLSTLYGYEYRHRIREATSADYKLLFRKGGNLALVTWTSDQLAPGTAQTPKIKFVGSGDPSYRSLIKIALAKKWPGDAPYPDVLPKIPGVVTSLTSANASLPQTDAPAPSSGEALANPGFESGAAGWIPSILTSGQRLGITNAVSRSGKMSAFMSAAPTNEASYFNWNQTVQAAKPGDQYTFTAYLKKEDVHGAAGWYVHVNGADGAFVLNNTLTSDAGYSNGWDKVSTTFTIPPGGTSITLGTSLYGTGVAYFDDASLVKGGSEGGSAQQLGVPTADGGGATSDLVANDSFESGDGKPTGWSADGADSTHPLSLASDGHTGSKSAQMVADPGSSPSYFSYDQYVHVTPGAYTFSAWVKQNQVQGSAGWFYHVYSGQTMVVNRSLNASPGAAGWTQVTNSIQVPPGADTIQIGTTLYGRGTACFDDATLTKTAN